MGTMIGDDGAGSSPRHQIGVAPGAKWIGCRNMDAGNGTPVRYIECMQWMMAPTDLSGNNPNSDLGAGRDQQFVVVPGLGRLHCRQRNSGGRGQLGCRWNLLCGGCAKYRLELFNDF